MNQVGKLQVRTPRCTAHPVPVRVPAHCTDGWPWDHGCGGTRWEAQVPTASNWRLATGSWEHTSTAAAWTSGQCCIYPPTAKRQRRTGAMRTHWSSQMLPYSAGHVQAPTTQTPPPIRVPEGPADVAGVLPLTEKCCHSWIGCWNLRQAPRCSPCPNVRSAFYTNKT